MTHLKIEVRLKLRTNSVPTSHKQTHYFNTGRSDFRTIIDVCLVNRNKRGIHCKSAYLPQRQLFIGSYHFILCGHIFRPEYRLSSGQYITHKLKITVTT